MLLINRFFVLAFYNRFGSVSRIHGKRKNGYEAMGMSQGMCIKNNEEDVFAKQ